MNEMWANRFTFITIITIVQIHLAASFDKCTSRSLQSQGYTYRIDRSSGQKIWSHCKFPHPYFDHELCGLGDVQGESHVCDPDKLVQSKVSEINTTLLSLDEDMHNVCSGSNKPNQGFVVVMAVLGIIRVPDLHSPNVCINDCGEIKPDLNGTSQSRTSSDVTTIMSNFADQLRHSWQLGDCGNDIVILYWHEYQKVYISTGSVAANMLTDAKVSSLQTTLQSYASNGELAEGFLVLASELRPMLNELSTAYILLIVHIISLLVFAIFFSLFLHFTTNSVHVWGNEKQWKILEILVYVLSGLWLIEKMFFAVIYLNIKIPYWALAVCSLLFLSCLLMYLLDEPWQDNTTF